MIIGHLCDCGSFFPLPNMLENILPNKGPPNKKEKNYLFFVIL
jgi:hypothetical protein